MAKPQWKRTADALTTTTPNDPASISRTPPVEGVSARKWTLHINGQFQDTYDTEEEKAKGDIIEKAKGAVIDYSGAVASPNSDAVRSGENQEGR